MITIIAKSVLKADKVDEYLDKVAELIEESRKEEGCISYNLFRNKCNPLIFTMIEEWRDADAIESHNKSAHFKRIVPLFADMRESSEVDKYEHYM